MKYVWQVKIVCSSLYTPHVLFDWKSELRDEPCFSLLYYVLNVCD